MLLVSNKKLLFKFVVLLNRMFRIIVVFLYTLQYTYGVITADKCF